MLGHATHGDASVLKPVEGSWQGLAITTATAPWVTAIDPYRGGKLVMDEMCRNLVSVGARPHAFSNCLNYGNPEIPERLGEFHETVRGLGTVAAALNLPTPSGNVSFYNESDSGTVMPTPVLLGAGIVSDVRKAVTSDIKGPGDFLYLVGATGPEMGGSAYYRLTGASSPRVPDVDQEMLGKSMGAMLNAIGSGAVGACHDVSDGGLAVTLAEMCIGGRTGASIDIAPMGDMPYDVRLFSETPSRWVAEVPPERASEFEGHLAGIPFARLGITGGDSLVIDSSGTGLATLDVGMMEEAWRHTLWKAMGGED